MQSIRPDAARQPVNTPTNEDELKGLSLLSSLLPLLLLVLVGATEKPAKRGDPLEGRQSKHWLCANAEQFPSPRCFRCSTKLAATTYRCGSSIIIVVERAGVGERTEGCEDFCYRATKDAYHHPTYKKEDGRSVFTDSDNNLFGDVKQQ